MTDANSALEFTGERFTPECVREIWYEHFHRYAFALSLVGGKTVLDAACGEGYGSSLLATAAGSVLGLDISAQAVTHATNRYAGQRANLAFQQADVAALEAMPSGTFDVICSFETLEHLHAQESMLAGFRRLLAPGGILLVSTPDKHNYSDLTGFNNEHHVRELYRDEFEAMLLREFRHVRLYAHKLAFQSMVWSLDGTSGQFIVQTGRPWAITPKSGRGWTIRRFTTSPCAATIRFPTFRRSRCLVTRANRCTRTTTTKSART